MCSTHCEACSNPNAAKGERGVAEDGGKWWFRAGDTTSRMVCTDGSRSEEKSKARLYVDLKRLNEEVKREHFVLPTADEIISILSGAKVFSSLDAASRFWQIPLHPDSCRLTTFIMPFGRFCFRRLPFGISSAPEIFQRKTFSCSYTKKDGSQ